MPVVWVSRRGFGFWKNGRLVGQGAYLNYNECIFRQGNFSNGLINDINGIIINYSSSSYVNIRTGAFTNGAENGTILEYVFPKSMWDSFYAGNNITSTRYTHTFSNGSWVSTTDTSTIVINLVINTANTIVINLMEPA
jgi:hypothetical protein